MHKGRGTQKEKPHLKVGPFKDAQGGSAALLRLAAPAAGASLVISGVSGAQSPVGLAASSRPHLLVEMAGIEPAFWQVRRALRQAFFASSTFHPRLFRFLH